MGGDGDGGVVRDDFGGGGGRWIVIVRLGAGSGRWGAELRVADGDDAIEAGGYTLGPERRGPCSGGFEVGEYGGKEGVVVAFLEWSMDWDDACWEEGSR